MALKLRVISDHYKALGKRSSRLFGVTGGRIGRAADNDWILPDPDRYVSSHHAKVAFQAGKWVLEDTSTNGVFINGADTPASIEGAYSLKDGDRLRMGDYEILVSIDDRNDFPPDASGQIPAPSRSRHPRPAHLDQDLGEELDLTDLLSDSMIAKASVVEQPHQPPPATAPAPALKIPTTAFDLGKALGLDMEPTKPSAPAAAPAGAARPTRSGFSSLLDSQQTEEGARTVTLTKKGDDWQMQTRPYDRKTLQAL